jgi:hypothetical protein
LQLLAKIIDANVPLTAAGRSQASEECVETCFCLLQSILAGETVLVVDDAGHALAEYRNIGKPKRHGDVAERFLVHIYNHLYNSDRFQRVGLRTDKQGNFLDYPDPDDEWTSQDPRCERFDPDDKKWVALAVRFKQETGKEAPIVNAADRCWLAFETHLEAVGVKLETLCRDERE